MFVNSHMLEKYFQWIYRPGRGGGFSLGLDNALPAERRNIFLMAKQQGMIHELDLFYIP